MKIVAALTVPVCALPNTFVQIDSHRQAGISAGRRLILNSDSHSIASAKRGSLQIARRRVVMHAAEINSGKL